MLGTATLNASQVNDNTAQGFVGGGIANGDYMNFTGAPPVSDRQRQPGQRQHGS